MKFRDLIWRRRRDGESSPWWMGHAWINWYSYRSLEVMWPWNELVKLGIWFHYKIMCRKGWVDKQVTALAERFMKSADEAHERANRWQARFGFLAKRAFGDTIDVRLTQLEVDRLMKEGKSVSKAQGDGGNDEG